MDSQNLRSRLLGRIRQFHLSVESTRTQQRRIQNVRTIGSRDHLDTRVAAEAVHRVQQLQQRALKFVGSLTVAASLDTDGVQLVDEDDAPLRARLLDLLLCEGEAIAHDLRFSETLQTLRAHLRRYATGPALWPTA